MYPNVPADSLGSGRPHKVSAAKGEGDAHQLVLYGVVSHQKRDGRLAIADIGLIIGLVMFMNSDGRGKVGWLMIAVGRGGAALRIFIDMINRNFFLQD